MKRNQLLWAAVLAAGVLTPVFATAQDFITNRLTFSGRFGLNVSAKFSGTAPIALPPTSRTTPDGQAYNYDNGYVFPDVSGSGDGYTWYWGYDDSASQINSEANSILLTRSSGTATLPTSSKSDDFSPGAELAYARYLGNSGDVRYGVEAAANFMNVDIGGSSSYALRGTRTTDAYGYVPGTTPPGATPDSPYQGTSDGPGYVIGSTPTSSTTAAGTVGTVAGSRQLDAQLWGGRLGPYLETDLSPELTLSLSAGLAFGWLDASVSWNETTTFTGGNSLPPDVGSGSDNEWLWGYYVSLSANWRMSERWSAATGVQFQGLGTYDQTFGTRHVELDLSKSFFFTLGVSYNF